MTPSSHTHTMANITDLPYTFVIDSDAKLANWANNTAGNDYSRILIKENTSDKARGWVFTSNASGGGSSNPSVAINIADGRTKSVVGESGSKITINNSNSSVYLAGIKGNVSGTYPNFTNPGNEYFFRNVNLVMNCTGSGSGGYGFSYCRTGFGCRGTYSTDCYMNQDTSVSPQTWAHSAVGGWNLNAAP